MLLLFAGDCVGVEGLTVADQPPGVGWFVWVGRSALVGGAVNPLSFSFLWFVLTTDDSIAYLRLLVNSFRKFFS